MDEENMLIHNPVLISHEKNEIMPFAGKWMELEIIVLSQLSQVWKDKYHV
jgi:hypothetical protein